MLLLRALLFHGAHRGNLGPYSYLKISWLSTLIPSENLIPLHPVTGHIYWFWALGHSHLWGHYSNHHIVLPTIPTLNCNVVCSKGGGRNEDIISVIHKYWLLLCEPMLFWATGILLISKTHSASECLWCSQRNNNILNWIQNNLLIQISTLF